MANRSNINEQFVLTAGEQLTITITGLDPITVTIPAGFRANCAYTMNFIKE